MGRDAESPCWEGEFALGLDEAEPDSVGEMERDGVGGDCSEPGEALFAPLDLDADALSEVTGFTRE